jgi:hypothetical protein
VEAGERVELVVLPPAYGAAAPGEVVSCRPHRWEGSEAAEVEILLARKSEQARLSSSRTHCTVRARGKLPPEPG